MFKIFFLTSAVVTSLSWADAPKRFSNAEVIAHVLTSNAFATYVSKTPELKGQELVTVLVGKDAPAGRHDVFFRYEPKSKLNSNGEITYPCRFGASVEVRFENKKLGVLGGRPIVVSKLSTPSFSEIKCPLVQPAKEEPQTDSESADSNE